MIVIQKVGIEHIDTIQSLANETWQVAYKEILSPAQLAYMLQLIYSKESLIAQLKEKHHQFIIAFENNEAAGFASYGLKNEQAAGVYKLHKIYVSPHMQGKGVGGMLLQYILNEIKPGNATDLELNVNRNNKAIEFYKSIGFTIIEAADIDIGNGYFMNDYVMNLKL
jgi:ribosomal protein S18 acetylase RimI-like enzyme